MSVAPYISRLGDVQPSVQDLASSVAATRELFDLLFQQKEQAAVADTWCRADHVEHLAAPVGATPEYAALRRKAPTPWLGLVEDNISQTLFVEGYRGKGDEGNASIWDIAWQQNGLDRRQIPLHRAAIRHGMAFTYTSSGVDPLTKKVRPKIKGYSARRMVAGYDDPSDDEWPVAGGYVIERRMASGKVVVYFHLIDEHWESEFVQDSGADGGWRFVRRTPHGAEVPPIVRFANKVDLEGMVQGEVIPFIPIAARIDQDTFDRLIVQRDGAWQVRYATGLVKPASDDEEKAQSQRLRRGDLLVSSSTDTRFGTLPASPLDGYLLSREADIRDLASVTQTPPQYLLGSISNLSADALAAAEASLMRKVAERKHSFGEGWEQTLRLAAHIMNDATGAGDYSSQVKWADIESRSLAQVADALGKLATMLEIPWEVLVSRIPGWTEQDTKDTQRLKQEQADEQAAIDAALAEQGQQDPTQTKGAQATRRPAA